MADTAYQCLEARSAHQVGTKASGNTTQKIATAHVAAVGRGTAGFRTTRIYAEILVGDFAAKRTRIILPLERLGPKDHTVFLDTVGPVLRTSTKVLQQFSEFPTFELEYDIVILLTYKDT
jgi:hypothetical protein